MNWFHTNPIQLLREFLYFHWCQTQSVNMADKGPDPDTGPQAAPDQSCPRQPEDQQRPPVEEEDQGQAGAVPETVVTPPSVEDVGEDNQADRTVYEDKDTEEIFTQQDAPSQKQTEAAQEKTTNKKIGALKTNFVRSVEKLMADPALRNPLEDSTDEDLEKARNILGRMWDEFHQRVRLELEDIGLEDEKLQRALTQLRASKYGMLYLKHAEIFDIARNNKEEKIRLDRLAAEAAGHPRRRSIAPEREFSDRSTGTEDCEESEEEESEDDEQDRFESEEFHAQAKQHPEVRLTPEEERMNQRWMDENVKLQFEKLQQKVTGNGPPKKAPFSKTQEEQTDARPSGAQQSEPSKTTESCIPTDEEVQAIIEQLKQAGQHRAAQMYEMAEKARIKAMKAAPVQLYEVPDELSRNYEAYIWTQGAELNWPEVFIQQCVETFKAERKFPGGIPLSGKLAKYQFRLKSRKEETSKQQPSNIWVNPDLLEANRQRAELIRLEEAKRKAEALRKAQLQAEALAKAQAESQARQRAQAQAEAQRQAEALADAEAQRQAEARAQAQAQAEAQRQAEAQAQARAQAQAQEAQAGNQGPGDPNLRGQDPNPQPSHDGGGNGTRPRTKPQVAEDLTHRRGNFQNSSQQDPPRGAFKPKTSSRPDQKGGRYGKERPRHADQDGAGFRRNQYQPKRSNGHEDFNLEDYLISDPNAQKGEGPVSQKQNLPRQADEQVNRLIQNTSNPETRRGQLQDGRYSRQTQNLETSPTTRTRRNSTTVPGSEEATFAPDQTSVNPPRVNVTQPQVGQGDATRSPETDFVRRSDFDDMVRTIIGHLNQSQQGAAPSGINPNPPTGGDGPRVSQPGTSGPAPQPDQFTFGNFSRQSDPRDQTRGMNQNPYQGGGGPGGNPPGRGPGGNPPGGGGPGPGRGPGGNPPGGNGPGGHGPGGGDNPGGGNNPPGGNGGNRPRNGNDSYDGDRSNASNTFPRDRSVFEGTRGQGPIGDHSYRNPDGDPNDCTTRGWTNRTGPGNSKMPPHPAPKFDGTTCYETFVNKFHTYVGNKQAPEEDKFAYLLECVSGQPRTMLGAMSSVPYEIGFLERAFVILRNRYGAGQKLDRYLQQRLMKVPTIKRFDLDSLVNLSNIIDEIFYRVRAIRVHDYETYFEDQTWLVTHLMEKIPVWEQQGYVAELTRGPSKEQNFLTFRDYIMWRYEQVNILTPFSYEEKSREAAKAKPTNVFQHFQFSDAPVESETHQSESASQNTTLQSYEPWTEESAQWAAPQSEAHHVYQATGAPSPGGSTEVPRSNPIPAVPQPGATGNGPPRYNPNCVCCGSPEHRIWACQKFITMKLADRYEFVRVNGLCYHCLSKGHGIGVCKFAVDRRCGIDGCQARHHRLVHKPKESTLCSVEEYLYYMASQPASTEDLADQLCGVSIYSGQIFNINDETVNLPRELERFEHVSIKTITCDLVTGTKRKRVVVAIDSGANNTNIDARLAEEMGLPVLKTGLNRQMHLVTRSEQILSNLVMFQLGPCEAVFGPYYTVGAFTVPGLIEGTPVPDWKFASEKYPYLSEANPQTPDPEDKVSILLGTDYSHLMVGTTTIRGEMGEPIAEKTPLGWAFQGRTAKEGQRERIGAMIEEHRSLVMAQVSITSDDPDEETGDGGVPPDEEFGNAQWLIDFSEEETPPNSDDSQMSVLEAGILNWTPDEELMQTDEKFIPDYEPGSDDIPRVYREQMEDISEDEELNLRSSTSTLSNISDDPLPESDPATRYFQRDQDETAMLIRSQSTPVLSTLDKNSFRENSPSEESLTRTTDFDWSESAQENSRQRESSLEGMLTAEMVANKENMNPDAPEYISKYVRIKGINLTGPQTTQLVPDDQLPKAAGHQELPLREEFLPELIYSLREQIQEDFEALELQAATRVVPHVDAADVVCATSEVPAYAVNIRSAVRSQDTCVASAAINEEPEIAIIERRIEENLELERLIKLQWEMEAVGLAERKPRTASNSEPTPEQWTPVQKAIDDRMKVVYLPEEKKFQMTIPWKNGEKPNFRCNRAAVKRRQEDTLNKLPPERLEKVRAIFQNYLEKDYIRKLETHEVFDEDTRYLPFFCVCDETKDTTPVRVVWDCRAIYHGKSLNSEIEDTPNRLQDLFRVLLRLRRYQFTITSDVSEMFLRVRLDPKDRPYHRFVFDGNDYIWNSILFGNVSSPNGSQKVLSSVCDLFGKDYPEAEETLRHSLYMDDASDSRPTEERVLATAQQLIQLLDKCTMPIHKFYSNSTLVLKSLEPKLLAKQVTISDGSVDVETGKILGMCYNASPEEDYLSFTGKFKSIREWANKTSVTKVEKNKWTKRQVARAAASIYDPHGLISPFTVRSKIILQEIWKHKDLDWDDTLPREICFSWEQWMEQVFVIPQIKIERWHKDEPKATIQIHTFCDASEEGMCAAVYIRVKKRKSIEVNLVAAKARVSPLKAETISRLELAACVMGVRLSAAVQELYQVKPEDAFYWTDSMVSLHWINTPAKAFKAFVANRIGEIQTHTEPRQWFHVPSKENPADTGTRQISATELQERELWWKGPDFLTKPKTEWPKKTIIQSLADILPDPKILDKEVKQSTFKNQEDVTPLPKTKASGKVGLILTGMKLLDPHRQSVGMLWDGLKKLTRRMAYVKRFIGALRKEKRFPTRHLHNEELQQATKTMIRISQGESFYKEKRLMEVLLRKTQKSDLNLCQEAKGSGILKFAPFLDDEGIIRSKSRLNKEEIYGFDKTYPVILNRQSGLAKLIAEQTHFEIGHPVGHNAVKARIASKYVIFGLGTLINSIKWRCVICQIRQGKPSQQLQAALPVARLGKRMRPFADTGLDYAGPFELKMGRGKARKKVWVLVLTCLATRAVHFEPTGGMETTNVLNAISRFADIRGTPETIVSDNQTSFVKADKDLQEWLKTVDFEYIQRATLNYRGSHGIEWVFNPPRAPHFGGVFEIIVKAMKRALVSTIGYEDLDEEEFRTVVSKATWILNHRPIQKVGDNSDFEALTPSHFLGGIPEDAVFPPDLPHTRSELQERLKIQIRVQQHLWERFQKEIIPELVSRSKWLYQKDNLKEGDIMVEIDEKTSRGHWKKVRITQIFTSSDNKVRRVEIRDGDGRTFMRPITNLIPLKI